MTIEELRELLSKARAQAELRKQDGRRLHAERAAFTTGSEEWLKKRQELERWGYEVYGPVRVLEAQLRARLRADGDPGDEAKTAEELGDAIAGIEEEIDQEEREEHKVQLRRRRFVLACAERDAKFDKLILSELGVTPNDELAALARAALALGPVCVAEVNYERRARRKAKRGR